MFWFNKNHPNAIYIDRRKLKKMTFSDGRRFSVLPDHVMDFRDLKFSDATFKLVVFDPPHFVFPGEKSWIAQKYGRLNRETWREDLKRGFDECWRVLEPFGVLIFKWSEEPGKRRSHSVNEIVTLFAQAPLFGHTSGSKSNTHWVTFMKIPPSLPSRKSAKPRGTPKA